MSGLPPLQLDIVVRAIVELHPIDSTALDEIARTLRITPRMAPSSSQPPPVVDVDAVIPPVVPDDDLTKSEIATAPDKQRIVVRRTRLYPLPQRHQQFVPSWLNDTPVVQETSPRNLVQPEPLFPARTVRGVLKALLATSNPDARVDIEKAIAILAEARPLQQWPRRLGLNMTRGAVVLVDTGPGLDPLRADVKALVEGLRNVIGSDRLRVEPFGSWPPEVSPYREPPSDSDERFALPPSGTPILIVSDFGLSVPRATRSIWEKFGRAIRAAGCEAIGLLPFPPDLWDPILSGVFAFVHWEHDTSARAARHARQSTRRSDRGKSVDDAGRLAASELKALAKALAPATRIEHALLRRMRRMVLPRSSPALEAQFWRSEFVRSRGELAATWDISRVRELRDALRAERFSLDDPRRQLVADIHGVASALHQLEEQLIALEISRPDDWKSSINGLLRDVLRDLIKSPPRRSMEIARWALYAFTNIGFDPPKSAEEAVKELLFAASLRVGRLPQGVGSQRAAGEVIPWIATALHEYQSEPQSKTLMGVSFSDSGLRLGRLRAGDDGHEIAISDGLLPAVAVNWETSAIDATVGSEWISVTEPAVVLPPPQVEPEPLAATITAQDGARWRIEDADEADGLAPLRLFVVTGTEEGNANSAMRALSDRLRKLACLHDAVPVIQQSTRIQTNPSSVDRSLWRSIQSELIDLASLFVVIIDDTLASPGWPWEILRMVGSKIERTPSTEKAIFAFIPGGRTPIAQERYDRLTREFPWLGKAELIQSESAVNESVVDRLADALFLSWRQTRAAGRSAAGLASALQPLALSFHVQAFAPRPPTEALRAFYGLDNLAQAGRGAPTFRDGKADLAQIDFEHVRYQSEYVFASHVIPYLRGGPDPFAPAPTSMELLAKNLAEARAGKRADLKVVQILRTFAELARPAEIALFSKHFGLPDGLAEWLANPAERATPDEIADPKLDIRLLDRTIRRFSAPAFAWRDRFPASFCDSRTFPEYIEGLNGLLVYYLRCAAQRAPETLVNCRYKIEPDVLSLIQDRFRSSFVTTEQVRPSVELERTSGDLLVLRLPNFADLVARIADAMMWGMRAEAARRLPLRPEISAEMRDGTTRIVQPSTAVPPSPERYKETPKLADETPSRPKKAPGPPKTKAHRAPPKVKGTSSSSRTGTKTSSKKNQPPTKQAPSRQKNRSSSSRARRYTSSVSPFRSRRKTSKKKK
jgi:hypothetical protein